MTFSSFTRVKDKTPSALLVHTRQFLFIAFWWCLCLMICFSLLWVKIKKTNSTAKTLNQCFLFSVHICTNIKNSDRLRLFPAYILHPHISESEGTFLNKSVFVSFYCGMSYFTLKYKVISLCMTKSFILN